MNINQLKKQLIEINQEIMERNRRDRRKFVFNSCNYIILLFLFQHCLLSPILR